MTKRKAPEDKPATKPVDEQTEKRRGAPKGNQFWKIRSSHGCNPIFEAPEKLWDACVEYFEWNEANPLYTTELTTYQGASKLEEVPKMRAMTNMAMCLFLDISQQTWANYRKRKDFVEVTTRAEAVIRSQKFEGASAGLLNPVIIARDLGLAEINKHQGDPDNPIVTKDVTDGELARRAAFLLRKSRPGGPSRVQANGHGGNGKLPMDS